MLWSMGFPPRLAFSGAPPCGLCGLLFPGPSQGALGASLSDAPLCVFFAGAPSFVLNIFIWMFGCILDSMFPKQNTYFPTPTSLVSTATPSPARSGCREGVGREPVSSLPLPHCLHAGNRKCRLTEILHDSYLKSLLNSAAR